MTLNKSWKRLLMAVAVAACCTPAATAVAPRTAPFDYRLPDGRSVGVTLHGSNRASYYLSGDGYVLLPDSKGWLYYAAPSGNSIAPTKIKVNSGKGLTLAAAQYLSTLNRADVRDRARRQVAALTPKGDGDSRRDQFPAIGPTLIPVVLVEFKDSRFDSATPAADIDKLLNDTDATSVSRYFSENSGGLFTPRFKVFAPVTLPKKTAWYGAARGFSGDTRGTQAVTDAIDMFVKANRSVDFSEFDNNNDGIIDNIAIVFAGRGQNDGGPAWCLWPTAGNLGSDHNIDIEIDGLRVGNYMTVNELAGPDGTEAATPATLSLALRQIIGFGNAATPGFEMSGSEPAMPTVSAPERMAAGWLKPRELSGSETVTLRDISHNEALKINIANSDDFYLIENRPGIGPAAWRIAGFGKSDFTSQAVDPAEVPGLDTGSIAIDPENGDMTFDFNGGGAPATAPEALGAACVTPVSFMAAWTPVPDAVTYEIDVCRIGEVAPLLSLTVAATEQSAVVTGLEPSTTYSYVVRTTTPRNKSVDSAPQTVTTGQATFNMLTAGVLPPTAVDSRLFTANWQTVPDAEAYLLSVYRKESAAPQIAAADFGLRSLLPEGWFSTTSKTGEVTGFYGSAAPSLDMAGGDCIASPVLADDITSVSFWYRPRRRTTQSSLRVEGLTGDRWHELGSIRLNDPSQGQTARIGGPGAPLPPGVRAVRLTVDGSENRPAVFIDDIAINFGSDFTPIYVDGYNGLNVGNSISQTIDGLDASTAYYYTVTAFAQGETSRQSTEEMAVTATAATHLHLQPGGDTIVIEPTADGVTVANNSDMVRDVVCTTISGETVFRTKLKPSETIDIPLGHNAIYVVSCHTASLKLRR